MQPSSFSHAAGEQLSLSLSMRENPSLRPTHTLPAFFNFLMKSISRYFDPGAPSLSLLPSTKVQSRGLLTRAAVTIGIRADRKERERETTTTLLLLPFPVTISQSAVLCRPSIYGLITIPLLSLSLLSFILKETDQTQQSTVLRG